MSSKIFSSNDFDWVACPICRGSAFQSLVGTDRYFMGIQTVGCEGCGLVLTNPQPTEAALNRFYRQHYRDFYQKVDEPDVAYIQRYKKDERSRSTVDFLMAQNALHSRARVIDIGASEGAMLKAVAERLPDTERVAVEPNPRFLAFAEMHADCAGFRDLAELQGKTFDLVIINHVLEHVREPVPFLKQVATIMEPTARLYIDVPSICNYSGLQDFHVAHLYHFGSSSLRNLLGQAGFQVDLLENHQPVRHPPSLRVLCSAGEGNHSSDSRPDFAHHKYEGWAACREAGRKVWSYRLRRSRAWSLLAHGKQVLLRKQPC